MKIKYPKGSLVRCTQDYGGGSFVKGQLYTVREDFYENPEPFAAIKITMDSIGSRSNGWGQKFFEPFVAGAKEQAASVLGTQIGGSHYTDCAIQPIEYIWANKLGFSEGNIIKYVTRWRNKGGLKDLEKAKHHIALLIEQEQRSGTK